MKIETKHSIGQSVSVKYYEKPFVITEITIYVKKDTIKVLYIGVNDLDGEIEIEEHEIL